MPDYNLFKKCYKRDICFLLKYYYDIEGLCHLCMYPWPPTSARIDLLFAVQHFLPRTFIFLDSTHIYIYFFKNRNLKYMISPISLKINKPLWRERERSLEMAMGEGIIWHSGSARPSPIITAKCCRDARGCEEELLGGVGEMKKRGREKGLLVLVESTVRMQIRVKKWEVCNLSWSINRSGGSEEEELSLPLFLNPKRKWSSS